MNNPFESTYLVCVRTIAHMSEDEFKESVLSFHQRVPGSNSVIRLGSKSLYLLRHLAIPEKSCLMSYYAWARGKIRNYHLFKCPGFAFYCCDEHHIQNQCGEKGNYSILQLTVPLWMTSEQESPGRDMEEPWMLACISLLAQLPSHTSQEDHQSGVALPTVVWAFSHQALRNSPTDLLQTKVTKQAP